MRGRGLGAGRRGCWASPHSLWEGLGVLPGGCVRCQGASSAVTAPAAPDLGVFLANRTSGQTQPVSHTPCPDSQPHWPPGPPVWTPSARGPQTEALCCSPPQRSPEPCFPNRKRRVCSATGLAFGPGSPNPMVRALCAPAPASLLEPAGGCGLSTPNRSGRRERAGQLQSFWLEMVPGEKGLPPLGRFSRFHIWLSRFRGWLYSSG